ncbi:MAG: glycosyltransferase family 4 protein [Pseudomonadota bacterium]
MTDRLESPRPSTAAVAARGAQGRPLVVGPLPPPVGGIATMVAKLFANPEAAARIALLDSRKDPGAGVLARRLFSLRMMLRLTSRLALRPRLALVFASAYASFWEKSLWLLLARLHGVPMAVMMVDGNFPDFYGRLPLPLRSIARRALQGFEAVIVQTASWRTYYQAIAPSARFIVLSNGVDMAEFPPRTRARRQVPVILFVGWLIPAKGVLDLIEAAGLLHGEGLPFSLQLLGPEHGFASELRQRIRAAGLTDVVRMRQQVESRPELLQAYYEADIFALPSWAEGLPNALMEAMASGLPVVATQVGGIPDVVEDEISGKLVPAKNPALLAAALRALLEDAELRARMGANASLRISTSFTNEPFIAGLRKLLGVHETARC